MHQQQSNTEGEERPQKLKDALQGGETCRLISFLENNPTEESTELRLQRPL